MSNVNQALVDACDAKNIKAVKAALTEGANIDALDVEDTPALTLAIRSKSKPIVKLLCEQGANPNIPDGYEITPLGAMVESLPDQALALLLIERGAALIGGKNPPFHIAVTKPKLEFAEFLLEQGVDIDSRDDNERTSLMLLCKSKRGDMSKTEAANARWLVQRGADVTCLDDVKATALHYAAASGTADFVQLLVDRGATITHTTVNNATPMDYCVGTHFKDTKLWDLLLALGNPLENDDGSSLLHQAVSGGNLVAVKYLLGKGADLSATDSDGRNALEAAQRFKQTKIVKALESAAAK